MGTEVYIEGDLDFCIVHSTYGNNQIIARFEHEQDRDYALSDMQERFPDSIFITYDEN